MTEEFDLAARAREVLGEDEWNRLRRRWRMGAALGIVAFLVLMIALLCLLFVAPLGIEFVKWKLLSWDVAAGPRLEARLHHALWVLAATLSVGLLFGVVSWRVGCAIMRRAAPLLDEGHTEEDVEAALRGTKLEEE